MSGQHTPGPWNYNDAGLAVLSLFAADDKGLWHGSRSTEEQRANSILCAAAPELLEALIRVAKVFPTDADMAEAGWTGEEITAACAVYDFARSAIAKATATTTDAGVVG